MSKPLVNPRTAIAIGRFDPSRNTEQRPTGTYQLTGDVIPEGSIILRAWYQVLTTFTSAGGDAGTIAITIPGATGNVVVAIAINDGANPWDAGLHNSAVTDPATSITTVVTNTGAHLNAVVAVQALTGGNMVIFVEYVQGD